MFGILIKIWSFFASLIPHWTVVVDTETTGLKTEDAELLQVSLISGTGRILFNKYIKPDYCTEWKDAQKVNHISPRMVKHCRSISSYVPVINAYLKHTKRIVGYNLIRYDLPILERYGISTSADIIDIWKDDIDKRTKPGERNAKWRKLTATARSYGYLFIAHDAVEDCLATLHVYCFMHPCVRTVLYLLRKIARVVVGALLIGLFCNKDISAEENAVLILNAMPYVAISGWTYVYGPFTGALATLMGISMFAAGSIPLIPALLLAIILGFLYGIVRSPKPWLLRILMSIVFTVGGGLLGLNYIPDLLNENPNPPAMLGRME